MNKTQEYSTNSFEETQKVAYDFAKKIVKGGIVALYGNLGVGKTTFTQGLARGLGIERRIISPTFIVLRRHKVKRQNSKGKSANQNSKVFYHIDLYRTESQKDIDGLGIEEILKDSQNIIVIEWAEKLGSLLPKKRLDVRFEYITDNSRKISINKLT